MIVARRPLAVLALSLAVTQACPAKDFAAAAPRVARAIPGGGPGVNGVMNLPYIVPDGKGRQWFIYQNGWMQQQGNNALYSQGAQLNVNGNQPNSNNNQARLDDKTGEVVLENMNIPGLTVTRRILIDKDQSVARYIDIIKNTGNAPAQPRIQLQTNFNYGINTTQTIPDPKRKGNEMAWVGQSQMPGGIAGIEIFSGRGSKETFKITSANQNSYVQAVMTPTIAPGKEIAILHLHASAESVEAGVKYVKDFRESQVMRTISKEMRKLIINFSPGQMFIGDAEILRGDTLDVVEMRGGDQYKGTLKEPSFSLDTFYGKVEVPVDQVIGLMNVGRFRPRQLLITADGQIFGGHLLKDTIDLELSSKQIIKVPLAQMTRIGLHKREGEPEEWTFEKPYVLMRGGERVGVRMPTGPIDVVTRYGKLSLKPESIAAILMQSTESGVHEVRLRDGSRLAGLVDAAEFPMQLDNAASQAVTFPAGEVARLVLSSKLDEPNDSAATLTMANEDVLVGSLTGKLAFDTAFDTVNVNAEEIKSLSRPTEGSLDLSVSLWDGTTISGQLREKDLSCTLTGGLAMKIPASMVQGYEQPQPAPSGAMLEKIKSLLVELNADEWKQRDRAGAALTAVGPGAIGALKEARAKQPPEAQQRIDVIVKELEKQRDAVKENPTRRSTDLDLPEVPLDVQMPN